MWSHDLTTAKDAGERREKSESWVTGLTFSLYVFIVYVHVRACVPQHTPGGQRTTAMWDLEAEVRLTGLAASTFAH